MYNQCSLTLNSLCDISMISWAVSEILIPIAQCLFYKEKNTDECNDIVKYCIKICEYVDNQHFVEVFCAVL